MIKVHMISDIDGNVFQSKVNKFIDDKKIIDIILSQEESSETKKPDI